MYAQQLTLRRTCNGLRDLAPWGTGMRMLRLPNRILAFAHRALLPARGVRQAALWLGLAFRLAAGAWPLAAMSQVTVTINKGAAQADPTSVSPIVFDVVFSAPVNGFVATDVSLSSSTAGGSLTVVSVDSGDHMHFTVSVSGMTTSGTVVASIPANAATAVSDSQPSGASVASIPLGAAVAITGGQLSHASTSTDNSVGYLAAGAAATASVPVPTLAHSLLAALALMLALVAHASRRLGLRKG